MVANATVQRSGDSDVVIKVKPFEGGLAVDDNVMDAIATTLGPDRFSSFLALGASQVQQSLENFGAEEETLTVTHSSSSSPGYEVKYEQHTPTSMISGTNTFPNLKAVSEVFGPITQLVPSDF
jgi:hypothetical protein